MSIWRVGGWDEEATMAMFRGLASRDPDVLDAARRSLLVRARATTSLGVLALAVGAGVWLSGAWAAGGAVGALAGAWVIARGARCARAVGVAWKRVRAGE
jgi:hypothetical protein